MEVPIPALSLGGVTLGSSRGDVARRCTELGARIEADMAGCFAPGADFPLFKDGDAGVTQLSATLDPFKRVQAVHLHYEAPESGALHAVLARERQLLLAKLGEPQEDSLAECLATSDCLDRTARVVWPNGSGGVVLLTTQPSSGMRPVVGPAPPPRGFGLMLMFDDPDLHEGSRVRIGDGYCID